MKCVKAQLLYFLPLLFLFTHVCAQSPDPSKLWADFKKYEFSKVYDSTYGITIYNNLIAATGGDSVRYDHKGHNAEGWIEDFYTNNSVLHKGYYVEGQLRVFKNFYVSGELERTFRLNDGKKSAMTIYYKDGKVKSDISYFGETIINQTDYFENGQKEYEEESDKTGLFLWKRISYTKDGFMDNSLEVLDKKKKKFVSKEFYPGNKLKMEGEMKLDMATYDYVKEGTFTYYDESGKVTKTEKYHNGRLEE